MARIKRVGFSLTIAGLMFLLWQGSLAAALPPGTFAGRCLPWETVNDGAFGMGTGNDSSYQSEEGFEVVTFAGRLYVGMEADNQYGARLWRTKAGVHIPARQEDWEEVAADALGRPFGNANIAQNDHIDSLAVFSGVLYASTANRGTSTYGTRIYSSTTGNPNSWTSVITAGFGISRNTNFKDMIVFTTNGTSWLCGGTQNAATGAQVWCTADGHTWSQKNSSGFGTISNSLIASSGVFSGALYFGVVNTTDGGSVWRTFNLLTWTQVLTVAPRPRAEIVGPYNDRIFVAAGAYDGRPDDDPTIRLYDSPTGNAGSWTERDTPIDDDPHNTRTIVDGATVYNGALYLATMNTTNGAEVWRTTDGLTWTQVVSDGFGDKDTFAAELIPFEGYLYAWTSNYTTGQRVYRTGCAICQTRSITGSGRFDYPGVRATLTFTQESLNVVTVCVRPNAFPTVQTDTLPLARTYFISAAPASASFAATLTLGYTDAEFAASDVSAATSLYLSHYESATWEACPVAQRAVNVTSHTVTCRNVTHFSTWAIGGDNGGPSQTGILELRTGNLAFFLSGLLIALLTKWAIMKLKFNILCIEANDE